MVDEPRLVTQELVELVEIAQLLRYDREAAAEPVLRAILHDELLLLLIDQVDAFVPCGGHDGQVVARIERQSALTVHQVVVEVEELFEKVGMKTHDFDDVAVVRRYLAVDLGNLGERNGEKQVSFGRTTITLLSKRAYCFIFRSYLIVDNNLATQMIPTARVSKSSRRGRRRVVTYFFNGQESADRASRLLRFGLLLVLKVEMTIVLLLQMVPHATVQMLVLTVKLKRILRVIKKATGMCV